MGEEVSGGEIGKAGNDTLFGQMPKTIERGKRRQEVAEAAEGKGVSVRREEGGGKGKRCGRRVASKEKEKVSCGRRERPQLVTGRT